MEHRTPSGNYVPLEYSEDDFKTAVMELLDLKMPHRMGYGKKEAVEVLHKSREELIKYLDTARYWSERRNIELEKQRKLAKTLMFEKYELKALPLIGLKDGQCDGCHMVHRLLDNGLCFNCRWIKPIPGTEKKES
jgi:hypothetical protein